MHGAVEMLGARGRCRAIAGDAGGDMRWVIVGTTGAGKTHLARQIGAAMAWPVVDLDELHWAEEWTPVPIDEFRLHS